MPGKFRPAAKLQPTQMPPPPNPQPAPETVFVSFASCAPKPRQSTRPARHDSNRFCPRFSYQSGIYVSMALYCRKRLELFGISTFFGLAVSAVVFQYYGNELFSYLGTRALHRHLSSFSTIVVLIILYLLPTFPLYLAIHSLNAFLVRSFGKVELDEQRRAILKKLLHAWLSNGTVSADPTDLVEAVAWGSLKKYWRAK